MANLADYVKLALKEQSQEGAAEGGYPSAKKIGIPKFWDAISDSYKARR
jgi:hypothetical protein